MEAKRKISSREPYIPKLRKLEATATHANKRKNEGKHPWLNANGRLKLYRFLFPNPKRLETSFNSSLKLLFKSLVANGGQNFRK
ncbi:MAG: hypothetical protein COV44_11005 [Deltaproteobacteria bacterium CG11_big_fil_rev_8_21_14_0_20_45_16]|nr:MAG: hypothetical protein COV44_11005 [Deltaproteobacteria bacterium CG11_big_fil_rev_8_21_14_0_20_45_16]